MDYQVPIFQPIEIEPIVIVKPAEPTPPEPKLYVVVFGDNLTKIAQAHNVPLERLWAANPELTDPNLITPEKPLKIPQDSDVLAERPIPVPPPEPPPPVEPAGPRKNITSVPNKPVQRSNTAGNTYQPGQCTWGVKNWRPSIPNGWGNASNWLNAARRAGWATGSTPKVGAVGWTSGHVVLVVGVKGDTVTIKEMNYNWTPYSVRTIDRPASKYMYIY